MIDSHCHIDNDRFDPDRDDVIQAARAVGVRALIVPGTQASTWAKTLTVCQQFETLYPALGIHPYFYEYPPDDLDRLIELIRQNSVIALGEIGLDFFIPHIDRQAQIQLLDHQLYIASELKLPVILHVRKAHDQILKQLKKYPLNGGICHAFNGSWSQAKRYIDQGFCLGFGGMLTYPQSNKLKKLAQQIPLDALVLETDAPDMSGFQHRYQRNSPAYLPEVLTVLEHIRPEKKEQIEYQTELNTERILNLKIIS